jgi:hypothetical protein
MNLSDAHLAFFWSLADFQGGRIIRPRFGIIRLKYPPMNLSDAHLAFFWSLADFQGGADYPAQIWNNPTEISAHESE